MKILPAVDGSAHTRHMLAYVAAHDEWLGPQHHYTLLTLVPHMPAQFIAKHGPAAAAIARQAERDQVDLLATGSHGHGSMANLLMGSIATRVRAQCRVPVSLVR